MTVVSICPPSPDFGSPELEGKRQLYPRPDSGKDIARTILETGGVLEVAYPTPVTDEEKQAQLDRLRAERFGIQGAIVAEFFGEVVAPGEEGDRPAFLFE